MSNEIPKDWEKEYNASFTKKIPFSYIQYDGMRLNPAIEGILYTFSTVKINKNMKFELHAQNGTYNELTAIIQELKNKRAAEEAEKPKEEEKKEEENKEEENKEVPAPQTYNYNGYGSQPSPPKKASGDLTEKALNILAERRRNQRKERIEEQKKKEEEEKKRLEEERKKKKEEEKKEETEKKEGGKEEKKKDEEEGKEDEEEKKENFEEATEDHESMYKVETEETFQQDMINCRHFF